MDREIFNIGGFSIKWYSVLLLIAIFAGILWLMKEGTKHKYPKDFLFNMCFWAIIFGFLGARAYYVIFNWKICFFSYFINIFTCIIAAAIINDEPHKILTVLITQGFIKFLQ